MRRANWIFFVPFLVVFIAAFGGIGLVPGGIYINTHELDALHILDIVKRMNLGQRPHLDFVTPLGFLAFWPIAAMTDLGFYVGNSILYVQILLALILAPFIAYIGVTRLSAAQAYLFAIVTLGIVLAFVFGGTDRAVSFGMYYNRWAWAISFIILALALFPSHGRSFPWFEGGTIAVFLVVLLFLKVTYVMAILPCLMVLLTSRKHMPKLIAMSITGVVTFGAISVVVGADFLVGYISDLQFVASNSVRPNLGVSIFEIMFGLNFFAASLIAAAATGLLIIYAEDRRFALAILALIPGLYYIVYQNYGNDPKWLPLIALLLLARRPVLGKDRVFGYDLRHIMSGVAVAALVAFLPTFYNLTLSPFRHHIYEKSLFTPIVPVEHWDTKIYVHTARSHNSQARVFLSGEDGSWSRLANPQEAARLSSFQGVTFRNCDLVVGTLLYQKLITEALLEDGVATGSRVFNADSFTAFWLYGTFDLPEGSPPWYYGGTSGLANSDFLVIPQCTIDERTRRFLINEIAKAPVAFELVRDREIYALFRIVR